MSRTRVAIMGAAGRDFHNFNTLLRTDATREVVAFTATQIPYIVGRRYPPELAGPHYPDGIPIYDESQVSELIARLKVDEVIFSYSDVSYDYVMSRASVVQAAGASFVLANHVRTMLRSSKPVIAVCAVRTGCGKSQTTRMVAGLLKQRGLRVAVVRHPMPYGDLVAQRCQRYESLADLSKHHCTIEEMEEYEPHLGAGHLVFAGVDYADVLAAAERDADVIVWDGGNNDTSFFKPDLQIVVADPHRPGHERSFFAGELNARLADIFVINKEDSAQPRDIERLEASLRELQPHALVVHADSEITVENPEAVRGKRVLCVEDGPTLTHGHMAYGAAVLAAKRLGAAEIVDPRPWVEGSLRETFAKYPGIGRLLPAMGYSAEQVKDLAATIDRCECDLVLIGTPIDLTRVAPIRKRSLRVRYELKEKHGKPLTDAINAFIVDQHGGTLQASVRPASRAH